MSGRPHWIIRLSCSGGVSVFSAGKSGLFYPHEGLIGSNPEVCSVVVWASSKPRSALSSQECPLPLRAAGLLQSRCSQVSRQPPHGCCQGSLVGKCSDASHCVFDGTTEVNTMPLSCVGLCSCRVSSVTDAERCILVFLCAKRNITGGHASIFNALWSKYTAAISAAPLFHSFLLAPTMRKKCKNVKALFGLWPLELHAACIVLFPELEWVRVDILDVSCSAGRRRPRQQQGCRQRLVWCWQQPWCNRRCRRVCSLWPTSWRISLGNSFQIPRAPSLLGWVWTAATTAWVPTSSVNRITDHKCVFVDCFSRPLVVFS